MEIQCIAGFGPITASGSEGLAFWSGAFGLAFDEMAPDYHHARDLSGANVCGLSFLADLHPEAAKR